MLLVLSNRGKGGDRCVTTLIMAAKETNPLYSVFMFRFRSTKEFVNGTVVQLSSEHVPQIEFLRHLDWEPRRNRSLCQLSMVAPNTRVRYFLVSFSFVSLFAQTKRPLLVTLTK